jgi:hypothetical protein
MTRRLAVPSPLALLVIALLIVDALLVRKLSVGVAQVIRTRQAEALVPQRESVGSVFAVDLIGNVVPLAPGEGTRWVVVMVPSSTESATPPAWRPDLSSPSARRDVRYAGVCNSPACIDTLAEAHVPVFRAVGLMFGKVLARQSSASLILLDRRLFVRNTMPWSDQGATSVALADAIRTLEKSGDQ